MKYQFKDNSKEFLQGFEEAAVKAMEECGLVAEGYAKKLAPVGTPESTGVPGYIGGTLRNSITYAVGGKAPHIDKYSDNSGNSKGSYSGNAPDDKDGEYSMYLGTNVEYAA